MNNVCRVVHNTTKLVHLLWHSDATKHSYTNVRMMITNFVTTTYNCCLVEMFNCDIWDTETQPLWYISFPEQSEHDCIQKLVTGSVQMWQARRNTALQNNNLDACFIQFSASCYSHLSQSNKTTSTWWWVRRVTIWGFNSRWGTFISVCDQPPRSTQPGHPFVGRRNEYQPKGGDALRAISERFRDKELIIKCYTNSPSFLFYVFISLKAKQRKIGF